MISLNTRAILLLTAPLIVGERALPSALLTSGQYRQLELHLRGMQCEPADLFSSDASDLIRACQSVVDGGRLKRLLDRGFLLSLAIERWQSWAIWVVSPYDAQYPNRFKEILGADAPMIYGCGAIDLLSSSESCVVELGMRSVLKNALESGHNVVGVLPDSLATAVLNREFRNLLLQGRLTLITPCDPATLPENGVLCSQLIELVYALRDRHAH